MENRVPGPGRRTSLLGRAGECALLDGLVGDIRQGESRSLVLRGEAGIGKTALLEYVLEGASDLMVLRAAGVESEMELAYASLQQLCAPLLDRLARLPAPQRQALEIVFGLNVGAAPDRFLVGLGVLSLLSEVAEERPLLCVIDDAQWLDQASALALAFVARRLLAEPVGIVFAAREAGEALVRVSELEVHGLVDGDARALLSLAVGFKLDERVRDRIVAETRGNPLALLELPRGLTATQLAGGFGLLEAQGLPGRIEESFIGRLETLSDDARHLLLLAAAEPVGDPLLLWRAAEQLGIAPVADTATETTGLLAIGTRVTFRHPLVRSAIYRSATAYERRAVHLALAEATDQEVDPDRRAWHLAAAAAGPDEKVALELERSAVRAQARGGVAATAAFLQRAVALTEHPARRVDRALAAAQASFQAGGFDAALRLLATAEAGPLDEFQRARVDLVRAHIAFASGLGSDAPPLLLKAARRLEPFDLELARETYLAAWGAVGMAGSLAAQDVLLEICRAVRALPPPPGAQGPLDLLLDGLALLITGGHAAAAATLQRAQKVLTSIPVEDVLRWGWMATSAYAAAWDFVGLRAISARQVQLVATFRSRGGASRPWVMSNAFRRFGRCGATPLVMLQHFRGNLDSWDPALTDALAGEREVILVDYPGVSSSGGAFGPTIADTARWMIAFITAFDLSEVDLVGFSIGGFVAQEIALIRPALVRRLVLAATGPKGGPGMHGWVQDIADAARLEQGTAESVLHIFFAPTETSRAKGREFLSRFAARREDRDPLSSLAARDAQYDAIVEWGIPDHGALQRLTAISCATLIIQGDADRMIPTSLSHLMAGLIHDAQIRIYSDSAHAFLFQEPGQVAADVNAFLSVEVSDGR